MFFLSSKRAFDADDNNDVAAAAAHRPDLPPGWHESFDPQYQRNYYYNYSTGERTWTKPEWKPNAVPVAAPAAPAAAALPASARWEKAIDPARGKPYFYNHATKESAWTLPEGATLLEEAIAPTPATVAGAPRKKQREEEPEEGEVNPTAASAADKDTAVSQASQVAENLTETKAAVEKEEVEEQPLPSGWAQAIDPGSGKTYYYNETLSITQWHHPSTSAAAAAGKNDDRATGDASQGGIEAEKAQPAPQRTNQPALDPMDPSAYSNTPRGGWGAGLGRETAM